MARNAPVAMMLNMTADGDKPENDNDAAQATPNFVARDLVFILNSPLGLALFFGLTWLLSGAPSVDTGDFAPISLEGVF